MPLIYFLVGCLLPGGILSPAYAASPESSARSSVTLRAELEHLAARYAILIKGLEKTGDRLAPSTQGSLRQQLKKLLTDFNYVLIQSPDKERIGRIIILSLKDTTPPLPEQIILPTRRSGNHHVIQAIVAGPKPARIEVPLLVDTGASLVVLPASMIAELGFAPGDLEDRPVQTANGLIEAKIGRLPSIEIGTEVVPDVEAAFIEDRLLGRIGLLGMNVLGRYRITIDDERNLISLIRQH